MPDVPVDIQFDSYELQDTTVITSDIDGDDSAPKKSVGVYELPVLNGAKKTFEKYQARRITLQGIIKSPTASGLVGKMEEMKEVVARQDKQLTLTYPSYTRIYTGVSSEAGVEFKRASYAINIADYSLTFVCPEPWSVQTTTSVSGVYGITTPTTALSVGVSGMLDPQPLIFFNTTASGSRFTIMNQTTGDVIDVPTTFSGSGRSLLIDPYNFQVTLDGTPVTFKGTFPRFKPGINSLLISTFGSAASALDQKFEETTLSLPYASYMAGTYRSAQSFVPTGTAILFAELYLRSNPTGASGDITVEIQTNSGGSPSGSVLGTATIAAFYSYGTIWKRAVFTAGITVTPGTTYWLVAYASTSAPVYRYTWVEYATTDKYSSGSAKQSSNSGTTWSASGLGANSDHLFRVYSDLGTTLSGKLVIQYNPRRM